MRAKQYSDPVLNSTADPLPTAIWGAIIPLSTDAPNRAQAADLPKIFDGERAIFGRRKAFFRCRQRRCNASGSTMMPELEAKRARLAAVERELAELATRHDLAMCSFKFDEARETQQRIAVLEREQGELIDALPAPAPPLPAPTMRRQRRLARRTRRRLHRR